MVGEISFDLKMEENMSFVEGVFRVAGGDWRVFIFRRGSVEGPVANTSAKWKSGVTGLTVEYPRGERLDKDAVLKVLGDVLDVSVWHETNGPDSMQLR